MRFTGKENQRRFDRQNSNFDRVRHASQSLFGRRRRRQNSERLRPGRSQHAPFFNPHAMARPQMTIAVERDERQQQGRSEANAATTTTATTAVAVPSYLQPTNKAVGHQSPVNKAVDEVINVN